MKPTDGISRRNFMAAIGLMLNGAVAAALAVPVFRYLLSPARRKPAGAETWISLGPVASFPIGETRLATFRNPVVAPSDGKTADLPCWVRRVAETKFQVFAINCAHLGCPVRWFPQSNLFLCPCHGGAYYADGSRASGPPERGLFEYAHRIERGELLIQAPELPTPGPTAMNDGKRHLPCV
jgi:menaquinol-cytochrome c reductase iron-sulfur subunit